MKNLSIIALATAMAAATAFPAQADSVTLKVSGTITPGACVPTISGTADYGTVDRATLKTEYPTDLEERTVAFSMTCPAATKSAITFVDNTTGQFADQEWNYALASDIGAFRMDMRGAQADGDSVQVLSSTSLSGEFTGAAATQHIQKDTYYAFGTSASAVGAYINTSSTIAVKARIRALDQLPSGEDLAIEGSATVEVFAL